MGKYIIDYEKTKSGETAINKIKNKKYNYYIKNK